MSKPIELSEAQRAAILAWAADDRLWTTEETVRFNLTTFARAILASAPNVAEANRLREALTGMLGNYLELKRISLAVARSDAPNWIGCQMTPEDDIHVKAARAALADSAT